MKLQDIKNIDKDDVLGLLGLAAKQSNSNRLLTALGTFGVGLLAGAAVALLLAPKAGKELRQDLRSKLRCDCNDDVDPTACSTSDATVEHAT
jgi:hypothetical protein